jgi:hypothetical protein
MSIVSDKIVGTLRGESDNILARFEHDSSSAGTGQVILSHGPKPVNLLKATVAYQQSLFPSPSKALSSPDCSSELYAGKLTYCTWNSLQDPVPTTATSIFKTLSYFPLMPNNLLIDDGWQTTTNRQMSAYGAQSFFLGDYKSLGEVVTHAKKRGVERVGVWHAVLGYWGGVYRESETFKHYRFIKLKKNWGATYDIIHPDQVQEFFDTWYTQLQEWGVDFVKCDDMAEIEDMDSAIDEKGNSFSLYAVRTAYVIAIKRAVDKYFNGRIIWYPSSSQTHIGAWLIRPVIYLDRTLCPPQAKLNRSAQVTITIPRFQRRMPITSTPISSPLNFCLVLPLPTSICFRLIRSLDRRVQQHNKDRSMRRYGHWGMDLLP